MTNISKLFKRKSGLAPAEPPKEELVDDDTNEVSEVLEEEIPEEKVLAEPKKVQIKSVQAPISVKKQKSKIEPKTIAGKTEDEEASLQEVLENFEMRLQTLESWVQKIAWNLRLI